MRPFLEIPTGYYDINVNNITYNLKQLILATDKFRKDDVGIPYASKRTSVCVTNTCYLRLEGDVAMILGFEPGATISNSLVTSPYLSLSIGNVSIHHCMFTQISFTVNMSVTSKFHYLELMV